MEERKILFADLYRLLGAMKAETKELTKGIEKLLTGLDEWEAVTMDVNGIVCEANLINAMTKAMIAGADAFLANGPYEGQTATLLPLESLAGGR